MVVLGCFRLTHRPATIEEGKTSPSASLSCPMVKPRTEDTSVDGGGSYIAIEKTLKKKKKGKSPPSDEDASKIIASNIDPSLLVRVPQDNRVNVDGVMDQQLQLEMANWSQTELNPTGLAPCSRPAEKFTNDAGLVAPQTEYVVALISEVEVASHKSVCDRTPDELKNATVTLVSQPQIVGDSSGTVLVAPHSGMSGLIAPQTGKGIVMNSGTREVVHDDGGDTIQTKTVIRPCLGLGSFPDGSQTAPLAGENILFKAGGSGTGSGAKTTVPNVKGPKLAGVARQRVRQAMPRGPVSSRGVRNRNNPRNQLPNRPKAAVHGAIAADPPAGTKE